MISISRSKKELREEQEALRRLREVFPYVDSMRISRPVDTMFVIVGEETSTEDDPGQWVKSEPGSDGYEDFDFEYLDETIVASGDSVEELVESARRRKRLESMTTEEYLEENLGEEVGDLFDGLSKYKN